jgi:hypothetical protein
VLHFKLGSGLIRKYSTRLEKLARNKHSSLLQTFVTYGHKKFHSIGPWSIKLYLHWQKVAAKIPVIVKVALLALAALGNATTNGNHPICDASPKEAKVSSATVAFEGIFVSTLCQCKTAWFSSVQQIKSSRLMS